MPNRFTNGRLKTVRLFCGPLSCLSCLSVTYRCIVAKRLDLSIATWYGRSMMGPA